MRLGTRARYALRMMLDVASNGGEEEPVGVTAVARRTGLSRAYLEQLALALRVGRLLKGVSGRHGGYRLAAPASNITIGQIIEASIGPVCLVDCLDSPDSCPRAGSCECRVVYRLINNRIVEVLQAYTLSDLLDPDWIGGHGGLLDCESTTQLDGCGCGPRQKKRGGRAAG